ncbi:hypothetical protein AKJ09_04889 [Labilithrix luteola]|uniref:DUF4331 domain-containing protein n=1 Tax=Labilithrix luteola TaxID=1391654 RepID=A0A0K1PXH5_9BACT|nr:DUF4331 family protein [Labilithrix luteola]AKU98225.1 hypothetical protein AKJ09_04889 [Labilithrix luteola]
MNVLTNKRTWLLALAAVATAAAVGLSRPALSADHRDAPKTKAEPAADINDVYTWVDGTNYQMVMTVFPFADANAKFSNTVQYVFHTASGPAFGNTTANEDVICTFDAAQNISCWVGTDDFVTGNANVQAGITSASGKTKVFAGLRSDPFFFNLTGFNDAVAAVDAAKPTLSNLTAGCPTIDQATSTALQGILKETASPTNPTRSSPDDFATAATLAIVVSVDKTLVTKGGNIVAVWASTNGT